MKTQKHLNSVSKVITLSDNEIELVHGGITPEEVVKDVEEAEKIAETIESSAEQLGLNKGTAIKIAVGAFVIMLTVGASWLAWTRFRSNKTKAP